MTANNRFGGFGGPERQRKYNELRDAGVSSYDAAEELGLDPFQTAKRYERWYQSGLERETSSESRNRRNRIRKENDEVDQAVHDRR